MQTPKISGCQNHLPTLGFVGCPEEDWDNSQAKPVLLHHFMKSLMLQVLQVSGGLP